LSGRGDTSSEADKRNNIFTNRLANNPQNLGFQGHERGHLLLPVPRDVVAVTEDTLGGFVRQLEISQRGFS
jgi:hypothetical protein